MTDPCDTVLYLKVLLVALPDRNMFLRNALIPIEPEHLEPKSPKRGDVQMYLGLASGKCKK